MPSLKARTVARSVVALVALAIPTNATAFCRTMTCNPKKATCAVDGRGCITPGIPLHWPAGKMPLTFRLHYAFSELLIREEAAAAIRSAFYRWSDVVCPDGQRTSLRFVEGEMMTVNKPLDEGAARPAPFGVYFRDHGWPHVNGNDQAALTTVDFDKNRGTILYADIEINTSDMVYATGESGNGIDLQTAVTHEVGHYIGLAHSIEPDTIMAAGLCDSGDRCSRDRVSARRLVADDISALCTIYPPNPPTQDAPEPAPSPTCSVHAVGSQRTLAGPFAAGLIAAFAARRRRAQREQRAPIA
jgi:hypothetical protein